MIAERPEENLLQTLAHTAKRLYEYNYKEGTPEEKKIYLPITEAMEKITPAWRSYTINIYATDDCYDLVDKYTQTISPKPRAILVNQWGDRFTTEGIDIKALNIDIMYSEHRGALSFYLSGEGVHPAAPLGEYCGRLEAEEETEGKYNVAGPLAAEVYSALLNALETGGVYVMPPTDYEPEPEKAPELEKLPF